MPPARPDPLSRALEIGLAIFVVVAPWPFGGVPPAGRLALEIGAALLLSIWLARSLGRGAPLPPRAVSIGVAAALGLTALQALPVGDAVVGLVSPGAERLGAACRPTEPTREAEERILGVDPRSLDRTATLSVDPLGTASALRTGAAAAGLLLVALAVGASGGARRVLVAFLAGAAFQALYGLLVLLSGHDRIWHVPKVYNLDTATGTYVNKNHFACLLAMGLACGVGLVLDRARDARAGRLRERILVGLDARGSRTALLGLLVLVVLAGLLTSFSRAGIAAGCLGLALAALGAKAARKPTRALALGIVALVAAVPLVQIGAHRLVAQYADSPEELETGRLRVWRDTLAIAASFPVVGSGFGTFAAVYPSFRSPEVRLFYDHAHNDALEVAAEGGILGTLLLGLAIGAILTRAVRTLVRPETAIGAGIAAALIAFAAHGLVDFNGHIPANLAIAAVLAGLLLAQEGSP